MITRRKALCLGLGTVAGVSPIGRSLMSKLASGAYLFDSGFRPSPVSSDKPLSERAAAKGLLYGTACRQHNLCSDLNYVRAIARECSILVPEWELKWAASYPPLRPTPDTFNFTLADWMADFAQTHGMQFRGHTLLWHLSLPSWFAETVTAQNAEGYLIKHIQTVVKRYAGRIHSWDVVNEAIELEDGRIDGLRKSPWLDLLGIDYIDLAFRAASEADPKALLVYNDYGLDYDTPEVDKKRQAVLNLLESLKARGTPIHAFGLQGHLGGRNGLSSGRLRTFLSQIASLDLKILVTELDVVGAKLPLPNNLYDRLVAITYEDYLNVVLDEPAVIAVLTWGLSDRYTWLSDFKPRSSNAHVRPLPLDNQFNRKLAWNALARAFDHAPKR